jgi:uncharacterized surface protein with fasciclin (FAS1) repeats
MLRRLFAVVALAVLVSPPAGSVRAAEPSQPGAGKSIAQIAEGNKDLSSFLDALRAAGWLEELKGQGPFTVFAPTNKAFEALGENTLKSVLADKEKLRSILTYHVVKGNWEAKQALALARSEKPAKTVNGADVKFTIKDGALYLNGEARVVHPDVKAANGVIHVIDKVILPPSN